MSLQAGEPARQTVGIFRLYSGDDGESHMEELTLASHPELTTLHGTKGVGSWGRWDEAVPEALERSLWSLVHTAYK